ncbi:MAG: 4a-hydroxytetrahydrobiopterin dehydratase, partial [Candidatus Colwellbacteria bacterium]|nr:4a-hydroxytetrahydrobiopterin dehydratase [Candidatus Colwellbacteria bacterium]
YLPGWDYHKNKITKTFEFGHFKDGVTVIDKLVPFCDRIDHHPDIRINYKKVTFELTSYSVGGKVTDRDVVIADYIEKLYSKYRKAK